MSLEDSSSNTSASSRRPFPSTTLLDSCAEMECKGFCTRRVGIKRDILRDSPPVVCRSYCSGESEHVCMLESDSKLVFGCRFDDVALLFQLESTSGIDRGG